MEAFLISCSLCALRVFYYKCRFHRLQISKLRHQNQFAIWQTVVFVGLRWFLIELYSLLPEKIKSVTNADLHRLIKTPLSFKP